MTEWPVRICTPFDMLLLTTLLFNGVLLVCVKSTVSTHPDYHYDNERQPSSGHTPSGHNPGHNAGVASYAGAGAHGVGSGVITDNNQHGGAYSGVGADGRAFSGAGGAHSGVGPDGRAYSGFGSGYGGAYSGVGPDGRAFSGAGGVHSGIGPDGVAYTSFDSGNTGAFSGIGNDGQAFSGFQSGPNGTGTFVITSPSGVITGTSNGVSSSGNTNSGVVTSSLPDGGTFVVADSGSHHENTDDILLSKKSCFCADNSDECDEREISRVYKPKDDEDFMPPCCEKKTYECNQYDIYRTYDGSCNNLDYPEWGVPNSTYSRLLPAHYGNGIRMPRRSNDNRPLPSARKIRVALFPTGTTANTLWNINSMIWGQFVAHDMSLLKQPDHKFDCCTDDGKYISKRSRFCYPIKIPPGDPTMGKDGLQCINFTRTMTDKDMGCADDYAPAQQINTVTDYLDLSNVYGLSEKMSDDLRTKEGGKLKTEVRRGHVYAPKEYNMHIHCKCNLAHEHTCYKTGDSRSNQNPQLAILQILFVKEHNRIATELGKINPHWDDETLFQEARRILIAMYQRITYNEWLPIFLGKRNILDAQIIYDNKTGFINDYDSSLPPSITNEHAHAAYRFFHTHIVGIINYLNPNREKSGSFSISDFFNRPILLESGDNLEKLTMSLLTQNIGETDNVYVEEVTDKLFACGKKFGIDLRAADIQRDRDHALGYYNDYRRYCGLKEAKSFEDYGDVIPAESIAILKSLYTDYRDVDLTVGGALETLAQGAQVGPTFLCILKEQFARSRKADRFWFENESAGFTEEQLEEIRKATVSRMYCDSGDGVKDIQPLGFTLIFPDFNPVKKCDDIHSMNFTLWKEEAPTDDGEGDNYYEDSEESCRHRYKDDE